MTLVDPTFLDSLPQLQLRNGSIEMFKHGLIADRAYWENMLELDFDFDADTFFPEINSHQWKEVWREEHAADEKHAHAFTFLRYQKK